MSCGEEGIGKSELDSEVLGFLAPLEAFFANGGTAFHEMNSTAAAHCTPAERGHKPLLRQFYALFIDQRVSLVKAGSFFLLG